MKFKKPKHVVIAIPAYTGDVKVGTFRSVLADVLRLYDRGDTVQITEETGNADISLCRAMIVAKFMAIEGATHLVMIDSDVAWQPGSLPRLIDSGHDFSAGIYPRRTDDSQGRFHVHMMEGPTQTIGEDGWLEVEAVPAGFICLKRTMLQAMIAKYDEELKISFAQCPNGVAWDLFDGVRYKDEAGLTHKWGEDYSFCKRWRSMGGRIYVDPNIAMGHVGLKIWKGALAEAMKPVEAPTSSEAA